MNISLHKRMMMMGAGKLDPLVLLDRAGGNFEGLDVVSRSTISGTITNISLEFVIRRERGTGYMNVGECLASDGSGIFVLISDGGAIALNVYGPSANNTRIADAQVGTLDIGGAAKVKINAVCTSGSISATWDFNGVVGSSTATMPGTRWPNFQIGLSTDQGQGKIAYEKWVVDGIQQPIYAPWIYGIAGTSNCGNGWTLTDGSPATFWT